MSDTYEKLKMEVIAFVTDDIITDSSDDDTQEDNGNDNITG